jgi:hypothetical protein
VNVLDGEGGEIRVLHACEIIFFPFCKEGTNAMYDHEFLAMFSW